MPELLLGAGVSREAVEGALLCADRVGRVGCAALLRRRAAAGRNTQQERCLQRTDLGSSSTENKLRALAVPRYRTLKQH